MRVASRARSLVTRHLSTGRLWATVPDLAATVGVIGLVCKSVAR
jgi:hypothetical protein